MAINASSQTANLRRLGMGDNVECIDLPPLVHSSGILKYTNIKNALPYSLPTLELQMTLIFLLTQAFYFVLKHFQFPKLTCQIMAGLMFSPSLIGHYHVFNTFLFNLNSQTILGLITEFGYAMFMFLIGVKMDLGMIKRAGPKAICTGMVCVIAPLVVGMLVHLKITASGYGLTREKIYKLQFMAVAHCLTPFPVVALLLEDLNILNSELGRLSMSSALISDIFGLLLQFFGTISRMVQEIDITLSILGIVSSILYILLVLFVIRPAVYWVIRQTPESRPVKKAYVNIILIVVLLTGVFSHLFGQAFYFGPFIFGLVIPAGAPLGSAIEDTLHIFICDILLPIFVSTCAMRTNFWTIVELKDASTMINGTMIAVTYFTKLFATMIPPLYCNMPFRDTLALALIMSCKGVVNLALYTMFRDTLIATEPGFALAVASIVATATMVPMVVKRLYDPSRKYAGYQRRNMMHMKPNAELRILTCIHRSANMPAVINLLDASCPTKNNPISLYVLHLMELIGRATPVFISHQMQSKVDDDASYSANVILFFNQFVKDNLGAVSARIFTAISAPKYMHEDICTLALDNLASLIVLPFHRKWSLHGSVESDDHTIRTLNCSVLDRAPCSVGILVDRGQLGRSISPVSTDSSFSVAVIFVGGKDDREALTFARRMTNDSTISLTVVRLVAVDGEVGSEWDRVLDAEVLKEFRYNEAGEGFVVYLEEMVKDGPQTALVLRAIAEEYDLIIVGRSNKAKCPQTAGLTEWSEFPELGTIGDLLASPDLTCKASIFVVQQQQQLN